MATMDYFNKCSNFFGGGIRDFLDHAPCPPPVLSYTALKTIALGRLCQKEVCSIARRCRMAETSVMITDCQDIPPACICCRACQLIIACSLSVTMIVTVFLIVAVCRRKKNVKQDAINAVLNDSESEISDRSSDKGTINTARRRTIDYENTKLNGLRQSTCAETSIGGTVEGMRRAFMCRPDDTIQDFFQCAPCPPSFLNYSEFRKHALDRKLCLAEVCNIAWRCRPEDPDVVNDCSPASTTAITSHTRTVVSSSKTTDHSINTADVTVSTQVQTTELFTNPTSSSTNCDSKCLSISIALSLLFTFVVIFLAGVLIIRRRRKDRNTNIQNRGEADQTEDTPRDDENVTDEADTAGSNEADANLMTGDASKLAIPSCNKPTYNSGTCCEENETIASDIDKPGGEALTKMDEKNEMIDVEDIAVDELPRAYGAYHEEESEELLQTSTMTHDGDTLTGEIIAECKPGIQTTRL